LSGQVSRLNREFPRTVPARSSPPPSAAPRGQVSRESVTQHNLGNSKAFQSEQKRRATYRSSGCSRNTRSRSRYWQRHSTGGISWNQIASRVFNKIHCGFEFNCACFCNRPQSRGIIRGSLFSQRGTEHRTLDLRAGTASSPKGPSY
jgi:hypothetical protein